MNDYSDVRIFLCTTPTDMHYSFDRLMGRVQEVFDQDPLSGHLFLFLNRTRDHLKILFWDQGGFCIWYKNLEAEDTQIFGFTEFRRRAHNQHVGVADTGRMVGIARKSGPRRCVMSGQGSPCVPPRALRQRGPFRSTDFGHS
jgi:hypothetical protein